MMLQMSGSLEAKRKADGSFLEPLPKSDCRPAQVRACSSLQ